VFQKTCDHVFDDKSKQNCEFTKIVGTLVTKSIYVKLYRKTAHSLSKVV